jgi:hypothetical protein
MPVQRTGIMLSFLPARIADKIGRLTARLVLGDLTPYKIPSPGWGPFTSQRIPLIDVGFVSALKRGLVEIRPAVVRLTDQASSSSASSTASAAICSRRIAPRGASPTL